VKVVHSRGVWFTQFLVWRIGWRGVARQVLGDRADERDRAHQRPRGAELPLLGDEIDDGVFSTTTQPPHSLLKIRLTICRNMIDSHSCSTTDATTTCRSSRLNDPPPPAGRAAANARNAASLAAGPA
jgi:hypothetical protein